MLFITMSDSPEINAPAPVLIVTGLSGAGRSSALKYLEDMGYEAFDNFPLSLIDALVNDPNRADPARPIAIGVDMRGRAFAPEILMDVVCRTRAQLLFMTADDAVLHKRFTETRRRHPLAADRPVGDGIALEKRLLFGLRFEADLVLDTSDFSVHDLRHYLEEHFAPGKKHLSLCLMSFGFRHGVPREADLVLDVRFLKNPHWDAELKPQTGLDLPVRDYVAGDPAFAPFTEHFKQMIAPILPRYAAEGKAYLTIAFGCTGGRHRSVTLVETLKDWFAGEGYETHIRHRDIEK